MMNAINLFAISDFPLIQPGDDLASVIVNALQAMGEALQPGDILAIAQKIVSKAEGRLVLLDEVTADSESLAMAEVVGKDPRLVQVVLDDSREVVRARQGLLIVEQNRGWVCANAGVDQSNVSHSSSGTLLALLPEDSDASATAIRQRLHELSGVQTSILITDSHGRAWRSGTVGVCIGCAGLPPLWDQRGLTDLFGYELVGSEECIADELSAAAGLLMGQSDEGRPVIVIRGYHPPQAQEAPAQSIQRPREMDVFR